MASSLATVSRPAPLELRLATPADVPALVPMLARAFDQDPMINFLVCQDERRVERMQAFFRLALTQLALPHNHVLVPTDLSAAALWCPPHTWSLGLWEQLRYVSDFTQVCGLSRLPKTMLALQDILNNHPKVPHYYLFVLGVDSSRQGQGLGSATIRPMLERCDAEGMPAYLETNTPRNLPLYQRHGFVVTKELVPRGGPLTWLMWREPQGSKA